MARKSSRFRTTRKKTVSPNPDIQPPKPVSTKPSSPVPRRLPFTAPRVGLLLLVLLAIGLLVRVLHLPDLSLWMDEYVHVMRAKNFLEGDGPLFTEDNNGILYTLFLLPGFAVFGPQAFWARFPSVLLGIGLIYLVYRMGARLFNRYVGLLAAAGATFSLYLIFWSRVCRNYTALGFFFLLLGLVFLSAFEAKPEPEGKDRWARLGISIRYMAWLPVVGALAFMAHQLTFFFVFTVLGYTLIRGVGIYSSGKKGEGSAKYLWLSVAILPFVLVMLVPALGETLKQALQPFLLSDIADWVILDWSRVAGWWAEYPWRSFHEYNNLLLYDLHWLYVPAIAGLAAAFWLSPKSGAWLLSSLLIPFLLLSFIFREPVLRRYFIFAFPYALISSAVFFYALGEWLRRKFWPGIPMALARVAMAIPFILVLFNARWGDIADLALARQLEGHIVDTNIASWSFTNWKEACDYVDANRRPGDVLMSTVPTAVSYYLQRENVLWFRQAYYDTRAKRYVLNTPNPSGGPSASTFEDLVRTVQQAPRGWLLADYYLENVFTDERALLWVYQNMHYYPEASKDGSVMVFGWDHSQPPPERQNMVVELGLDDDKIESKEYHMTLPEALFTRNEIEMTVRTRGVDTNREAMVLFNGENAVWLPPNTGSGIEERVIPINRDWIRPGANTVRILYETKRPSDLYKGFTLYFLSIAGK